MVILPAVAAPTATPPVLAAATPWLADRLSGPPRPARVLAAGPQAVYVDDHGVAVGVLASGAVAVPLGLRTRLSRLPDTVPGDTAVVGDRAVRLAGSTFTVARISTATVPALPALRDSAGAVCGWPLPGAEPRFDAALDQLPAGALWALAAGRPAAVADLIGRGDGLTPVGDDVLAGWLVARRAAGLSGSAALARTVRAAHGRTTTFSATLLDRAADGETVPALRALLVGLASGAPAARIRALLDDLLAIGHSSGAGLAVGVALALTGAPA